jgi:hypothetical protein
MSHRGDLDGISYVNCTKPFPDPIIIILPISASDMSLELKPCVKVLLDKWTRHTIMTRRRSIRVSKPCIGLLVGAFKVGGTAESLVVREGNKNDTADSRALTGAEQKQLEKTYRITK